MLFLIKYFTITVCSIYIYHKFLNLTYKTKELLLSLIFSLFVTCMAEIVNSYHSSISIILIVFSLITYYVTLNTFSLETNITTTLLSFAISYISFSFACLIVALLSSSFLPYLTSNLNLSLLIAAIIQIITSPFLFYPKRLRKGMPFLINGSYCLTLILISLSILFMFITMRKENNSVFIIILTCISFIFALFIYIYWRNSLTRTYNERLRLRDIDDLSKQLENKQKEYDELKADKEYLSSIVHTDNKLVPAMVLAVESFLTAFPDATPQMIARGKEILHTLDNHIEARNLNLSLQQSRCFVKLANTGIPDLNITLEYMYDQAQKQDMELGVQVESDIDFLSLTPISENELNTMVSDLLQNAIIANSYGNGKRILFTMGTLGNALSISIFDSGIPFDKEVLVDFGKEKHTTHADNNGSGIGLMTIYEIAQKYRATIAIEEYNAANSYYTKRIAVTFNKRGNYILNTSRDKNEIAFLRQRSDLIINVKSDK